MKLREAARFLHIAERLLEVDIRQLAFYAEVILEASDAPTRKLANTTVIALTTMYLRGHGLKMGSRKSILANLPFASVLAIAQWELIISNPIMYPCFHKLGYTSVEKLSWRLRKPRSGVLEEAQEILEKKAE